eukprot:GHVR01140527.1.p1 GENE.GHVR01140527.1~~GHVR01140527.1.p1  ORF type:complete len:186 (-),score=67.97 GHVR01140527.1:136-693(-)
MAEILIDNSGNNNLSLKIIELYDVLCTSPSSDKIIKLSELSDIHVNYITELREVHKKNITNYLNNNDIENKLINVLFRSAILISNEHPSIGKDWFKQIYSSPSIKENASLYIHWAKAEWADKHKLSRVLKILKEGIESNAQPYELLSSAELQYRALCNADDNFTTIVPTTPARTHAHTHTHTYNT